MMKRNERFLRAASWAIAITLFFGITAGFTSSRVKLKNAREDNFTASSEEQTTQTEDSSQHESSTNTTKITESTTKSTPDSTTTTEKTVVTATEKTTKKQTASTTVRIETTRVGENRPAPAAATKKSYTVTFNTGGGTAIGSQAVTDGDYVVKPADPKRQGFKFEGWYKDAALKQPLDFKKDRVAANVTVYAKWSTLAGTITYKITYNPGAGGGHVAATPPEAVGGESVLLIVYPDKGKRIKAGTLTVNGNPLDGLSFKMPEKNVIVNCEFEDAPIPEQEGTRINRKYAGVGVLVILCAITLIVMGIVLREKSGYVGAPEWTDESIVLSEYRKNENENEYEKNRTAQADTTGEQSGESDSQNK
ncbi:MAG TPA: InlB B-repeat-containing protein [Clostridiales bacterium]|jgi:uncharacterized repeat protein (TIGR02543 family)|nr:InlB B-repeat-containing protein [Clostridiales bacterium]